jgi:hypothetical protein
MSLSSLRTRAITRKHRASRPRRVTTEATIRKLDYKAKGIRENSGISNLKSLEGKREGASE